MCNIIDYTAFCFIPHRCLQLLVFGSTLPPSPSVMYDWVIARYGQRAPQPSRLQHLSETATIVREASPPPPQHSFPFPSPPAAALSPLP